MSWAQPAASGCRPVLGLRTGKDVTSKETLQKVDSEEPCLRTKPSKPASRFPLCLGRRIVPIGIPQVLPVSPLGLSMRKHTPKAIPYARSSRWPSRHPEGRANLPSTYNLRESSVSPKGGRSHEGGTSRPRAGNRETHPLRREDPSHDWPALISDTNKLRAF